MSGVGEVGSRPPTTFYRILVAYQATRSDFMSNDALGKLPNWPLSPAGEDRWRGLSVFDSLERTQRRRDRSPWIGTHVAEIRLSTGIVWRAERTTASRGHWTLWADPDDLLDHVAGIIELT